MVVSDQIFIVWIKKCLKLKVVFFPFIFKGLYRPLTRSSLRLLIGALCLFSWWEVVEGPGRWSCCVFTKGVCMHMHMCLCVSICGWKSALYFIYFLTAMSSVCLFLKRHISRRTHLTLICTNTRRCVKQKYPGPEAESGEAWVSALCDKWITCYLKK